MVTVGRSPGRSCCAWQPYLLAWKEDRIASSSALVTTQRSMLFCSAVTRDLYIALHHAHPIYEVPEARRARLPVTPRTVPATGQAAGLLSSPLGVSRNRRSFEARRRHSGRLPHTRAVTLVNMRSYQSAARSLPAGILGRRRLVI